MSTRDERNHILQLVETGRVTAEQAGQLLDMLDLECARDQAGK